MLNSNTNLEIGKNYFVNYLNAMPIIEQLCGIVIVLEDKEKVNLLCGTPQDLLQKLYILMVEKNKTFYIQYKITTPFFSLI